MEHLEWGAESSRDDEVWKEKVDLEERSSERKARLHTVEMNGHTKKKLTLHREELCLVDGVGIVLDLM